MGVGTGRNAIAAAVSLLLLCGCETSVKLGDLLGSRTPTESDATGSFPPSDQELPPASDPVATGSLAATAEDVPQATSRGLLGSDPNDDLSLGKKHYRAANFGLAERHFRRAVESHPTDGEAWVGLAASYDRLRRFDLADRAYARAIGILGQTPELLNNKGYSYILRGDYRRARETLIAAKVKDPSNPYIQNNLELLEKSFRQGKAIQ
jgi:Flp pilus assembly protein TadD